MDSRIIIGDKLDIQKLDSENSDAQTEKNRVYSSRVLDEMQNGNMLVSMPYRDGKMVPFSVGQEIQATFYTKSGLLRCQSKVMGRYKNGNIFFMELEQETDLIKVQRREYYRMDCYILIEYRIVGEEERKMIEADEFYDPEQTEWEWKSGTMLDLSGGGSHFVSAFQEEKDTMIQLRFDIHLGEKIESVSPYAMLLRSERNKNNSTIYDNYIMFWNVDGNLREKIIRYIFDAQRRKRSKDSGMS
ncbi:MAG: flagellar brake protein [Bacteroidales bacterium]|nr:flagellar brake protein [Clostridium sp.]MCM1202745.1 flagellar brake protein [Bacteroidales bacterium]